MLQPFYVIVMKKIKIKLDDICQLVVSYTVRYCATTMRLKNKREVKRQWRKTEYVQ